MNLGVMLHINDLGGGGGGGGDFVTNLNLG